MDGEGSRGRRIPHRDVRARYAAGETVGMLADRYHATPKGIRKALAGMEPVLQPEDAHAVTRAWLYHGVVVPPELVAAYRLARRRKRTVPQALAWARANAGAVA